MNKIKKIRRWISTHTGEIILSSICITCGAMIVAYSKTGVGIIFILLGFFILVVGAKN